MKLLLIVAALLGFGATQARANLLSGLPELALGPIVGTSGIGVQAAVPVLPGRLNLNTGFSTFSMSHDVTADGTRFHGKLRLGAVPVYLSYYPFGGVFHLNAGVYFNENRASVQAAPPPDVSLSINGTRYSAGDIGTLSGRTRFHPVAPYLGFGFGNPFLGGRFTVTFDAGVMFEGGPNIRLAASNPAIHLIPGADADIRHEQDTLNHKASFIRYYPVVNLGIVYRF